MSLKKTILVVDDEKNLRMSLSFMLQKEGYEVENAANGREALEHLRARSWDLMFLDLNMPGMSGIDLLVEIHMQYPFLSVLILTAHATLETAVQAVRLGARDYLIKPAEPNLILVRVSEILTEDRQPLRKKEIVGEIQNLIAELQKIEGTDATPTSTLAALPPTDSTRFLQADPFVIDLHARHVTLHEKYIPITGIYFDYLVTLLRHAPKSVSYKNLVKESQGYDVELVDAKDLTRWRIHELRKLIEQDPQKPQYILTVRGTGYRLAL